MYQRTSVNERRIASYKLKLAANIFSDAVITSLAIKRVKFYEDLWISAGSFHLKNIFFNRIIEVDSLQSWSELLDEKSQILIQFVFCF